MRKFSLLILLLLSFSSLNSYAAVVKRIEIEGLKWTKERFVRRELLIKEGKEFNPKDLSLSVRNLLNTHLFYRVETSVKEDKEGVTVKLRLKEKFPIVPLPRVRFKDDGSYKAGMEVRHYNLFGMGHKLYTGYVRWYNTDKPSKKVFVNLSLYRIIYNTADLSLGAFYQEDYESLIKKGKNLGDYKEKSYTFPVSVRLYLDREKINQITFGLTPYLSFPDKLTSDKHLYYLNLRYTKDYSTDMVYYTLGKSFSIGGSLAAPEISSVFTGKLDLSYLKSIKRGDLKTILYRVFLGTKVGYSGNGYNVSSPIPGYKSEEVENKRYVAGNFSYRFPVVDKSVFVKPSFWVGDSFENTPDDILISAGVEVTAFWARLADGIIKFKLFRGLGSKADTQSYFKLSFRW